jgi:hypothetical protein
MSMSSSHVRIGNFLMSVQWSHILISSCALYMFDVGFVAKTEMFDLMRKVYFLASDDEVLDGVLVGMGRHVEVARNFVDKDMSCDLAALCSLESLCSILNISLVVRDLLVMCPTLNDIPTSVNPVLDEISIKVNNMGEDDILNVQGENIAGNVGEINVQIDSNLGVKREHTF